MGAPIKIIICRSNSVDPDPRVEKIATTLANGGYTVQVLGWDRSGKLPNKENLERYVLHRLLIKAEYGTGLSNLPNLLRWQWTLASWLFRNRHSFDIIHACDFDTVIPALICQWLFGKRIVYDIFDFYADHLRKTPALVKKTIRTLDLFAINKVDALILADASRKAQIKDAKPKHWITIYNSPQDLTHRFDSQGAFEGKELRLAYIGLLQVERGLFEVMELLNRHSEWSLDLAGFGGDEAQLVARAQELSNVTWHGRVPYQKALELSAKADALFATYDPAIPNHRFSSPNKVFEAMMLGKPIVVARDTNMDRIIAEENCGIIVTYGDVDELETALSRLASEPSFRLRLGANARKAYEKTYSWNQMEQRLLNLYEQVSFGLAKTLSPK